MTTTTTTGTASTATLSDTDVVRAVFQAFADADLAALGGLLHADATSIVVPFQLRPAGRGVAAGSAAGVTAAARRGWDPGGTGPRRGARAARRGPGAAGMS